MALLGAALVAAALGTATSSPPAADALHGPDMARLQAQLQALTAETPAGAPTFVERTASSARARVQAAEAVLRRVGLDPQRFAAGTGGPYVPASASDPRVRSLVGDWQQAAALEAAIAAIPSYVPVKSYSFSSPFGVRSDPFNGRTAMHAGLDMSGSQGEPIYAAADGDVVTGGRSGAYGNLVELDHGKGLATRYGHLSAILVHPGEHVRQGQLIARMGSTGRSTGTHLHYEIRLDGRAINPRPFLEASGYMLAAQGREAQGPALPVLVSTDDTVYFSINRDRVAVPVTSN